ncbi:MULTISPECIES: S-layer family protein [unclassified Variovorax]|uniref:S-layer family protein n=1 Tax=unclassified Variovorax TaxID=663243 RepID=UPI00076CE86A|nr:MULTISPECIES: S-layer family protein [unclassified Variovorax]KWT93045.1 Hemolysin [Variovorax sp. WDL1]
MRFEIGSAVSNGSGTNLGDKGSGAGAEAVTRKDAIGTAVPNASLFSTRANRSSRYLVETDPRFANYRSWLNSDYLLDRLGLDADLVQKRLGDGFYEQRLIREQIAQLTGYRYLDGFQNDEEQYAALMSAGTTFAQAYGLSPAGGGRIGQRLRSRQAALQSRQQGLRHRHRHRR